MKLVIYLDVYLYVVVMFTMPFDEIWDYWKQL